MDDLYGLMTDDYRSLNSDNEDIVREANWGIEDAVAIGAAAGLAIGELSAEQVFLNQHEMPERDPAAILEDFQESVERVSLRSRDRIKKNNQLAFERYVSELCGIEEI